MEDLTLVLEPINPSELLPGSGRYVLIRTIWRDEVHYGFWHEALRRFYWMGDSADLKEVRCWYDLPRFMAAKG